ncbi:MAG TPA: DNA mismatch repair endonuclease MutL [Chitinivibrionales bacterium]|nr:DNA mismatch repair endonuclease MutL [Chitinivibrionales bacterium]
MQTNDPVIRVLPQQVVEKIAAGEVIERPASVLKEIIENAIDAGATKIDIVIEDSGFSLIQVSDNGSGMSPVNLEKSVLRHATSKIATADDLYAVSTMGFRGEALASIAAVSRTVIASSATQDGLGYSLGCDGGVAAKPKPVPHVRGTTVSCRDLFFNVPARKKFMKTRKAERMALARLIEQIVIPFPSMHFTAVFEGKPVFDVPPADSLLGRISQVAGVEFAKTLVMAQGSAEGMEATLFFPLQDNGQARPRYQNLYVNLRRVDNDSVLFAVRQAFAQLVRRDFRPSFFCFIDIDPSLIDVNVHPTKQKVKFEDEQGLFRFIYAAVSKVLKPSAPAAPARTSQMEGEISTNGLAPAPVPAAEAPLEESGRPLFAAEDPADGAYGQTILAFPKKGPQGENDLDSLDQEKVQLADSSDRASWSLISCFQIHEMFILAPIKNGILLIDQHAAHERILYEQALDDLKVGRAASQQLLFPVVIRLTATEKTVVGSSEEYFRAFGFDIQDFGGNEVSVSATPSFMKSSDIESSVRDMIGYLLDEKSMGHFPEPHKRFAAAFACGAAIKAGQKLSQEEMMALLNSLFSAQNPYTCPHGRPTVVRISIDELSRRFLR